MGKRIIEKENVVRGRRVDFLGYCFTHEEVRLRKSIKQNFAIKTKRIKSQKRRHEVLASYWGWCKHGNCTHLWRKITNNDMSFADKGIKRSGVTKDGKKYFEVEEIRMMDIINVPIKVLDCIEGVKTKMGDGRMCILLETEGKKCKVITNSYKIKDVLSQAVELEKSGTNVFPVENVIIRRRSLNDGKSDFYFEE